MRQTNRKQILVWHCKLMRVINPKWNRDTKHLLDGSLQVVCFCQFNGGSIWKSVKGSPSTSKGETDYCGTQMCWKHAPDGKWPKWRVRKCHFERQNFWNLSRFSNLLPNGCCRGNRLNRLKSVLTSLRLHELIVRILEMLQMRTKNWRENAKRTQLLWLWHLFRNNDRKLYFHNFTKLWILILGVNSILKIYRNKRLDRSFFVKYFQLFKFYSENRLNWGTSK